MVLSASTTFKQSNDTHEEFPRCKVYYYAWEDNDLFGDKSLADIEESKRYDISHHITGCTYSKTMSDPAGSFTFRLSNNLDLKGSTGDWKDFLKKGSWVVIMMDREGVLNITPPADMSQPLVGTFSSVERSKIRCVGRIDRVAVSSSVDDKGALDVTYEVTGRDFGVAYADTTIWHNTLMMDKAELESFALSRVDVLANTTLNDAIDVIHDLMLAPENVLGAKVDSKGSLSKGSEGDLASIALQWIMPKGLIRDLGLDTSKRGFFGYHVDKILEDTPCAVAMNSPVDFMTGNCWEALKRISVPELHELFTELSSDGKPTLHFRPIPFGRDSLNYQSIKQFIPAYLDVDFIIRGGIDILTLELGEDEQTRYNSFLLTIESELISHESNASAQLARDFPYNDNNSIRRHGFKPMHVTVNTLAHNKKLKGGTSDLELVLAYNYVLLDYWQYANYSESGSVTLLGNNDVKVGKCMVFDDTVPYANGRRYYIEGYTDTFSIDEKGAAEWEQHVDLTRGFEEQDLLTNEFTKRAKSFTEVGEFTPTNATSGGV